MKLVYFNQEDPRWKNTMYSVVNDKSQTIGLSGCGPTSSAMAISSFTGKEVLPTETAAYSVKHRYRTENSGTAWALFPAIMKEYGLDCLQTGNFATVKAALADGKLVIASMKQGHFTSGGHFILLVGVNSDGSIDVYDPNKDNTNYTRKYGNDGLIDQGVKNDGKVTAKSSIFQNEARQFWIVSKPEDETIDVTVNSKKVAVGYVIDCTTYIQARAVAEALGGTVGYENGHATVNGKAITTKLIDGQSYSPVREVIAPIDGAAISSVTATTVSIVKK